MASSIHVTCQLYYSKGQAVPLVGIAGVADLQIWPRQTRCSPVSDRSWIWNLLRNGDDVPCKSSPAEVKNGLPRDVALRLAAQTVFGAAKMTLQGDKWPGLKKAEGV